MEQLLVFVAIAVVFGVINAVVEKVQAAKRAIQVAAEQERQRQIRDSMGTSAPDYTKPFVGTTFEKGSSGYESTAGGGVSDAKIGAPQTGTRSGPRRSGGVVLDQQPRISQKSAAERWREMLEGAVEANERAATKGVEMRAEPSEHYDGDGGWHPTFEDEASADSPWGRDKAAVAAAYGSDAEDSGDEDAYDFGGDDRLAGGGSGAGWSSGWNDSAAAEGGISDAPVVGVRMGNAIGERGEAIGDGGAAIGDGGAGIGDENEAERRPVSAAATVEKRRRKRRPVGIAGKRLARIIRGDDGGSPLRTLVLSDAVLRAKYQRD